jgi:hypothetical protein
MTNSLSKTSLRLPTGRAGAIAMLIGLFLMGTFASAAGKGPRVSTMQPNSFKFWDNPKHWTTSFGPAYADILLESDNFVPCKGGPIALCYYSGPAPATCRLREDGRFADCECYLIPYGPYYVDINSVLNQGVYRHTVALSAASARSA